MTDPVELALQLVQSARELQWQRERGHRLSAELSKLNSRHQRVMAELASAHRERARAERVNRALPGQVTRDEQAALVAEQAVIIAELQTENTELRQKLDEALQAGKRQAHPFRRRIYMDNPKTPGRQRGEGNFSHRRRPPEDRVTRREHEPLVGCPVCGCAALGDLRQHQNWQLDLPQITTDITQFVTESAWCPCCNQRVQSRHPEQLSQAAGAAGVCFGPRLLATAADLHARLGVPYAKIADFLGTMIGETITAGALCQNLLRLAELTEPAYRELIGQLRLAMVVHADETGWRIGTLNAWLWVFTNQDTTVYLIRSGEGARGHHRDPG